MPSVLLDRRRHPVRSAAREARPLALCVDRDALGEVPALEDPDVQQPVDEEVVHLGDVPAHLEAQVVDGGPASMGARVELDLVGGVALAGGPGPDPAHLAIDPASRGRAHVRPLQQRRERVEVRLLVVGWLDLRPSPRWCGLT